MAKDGQSRTMRRQGTKSKRRIIAQRQTKKALRLGRLGK